MESIPYLPKNRGKALGREEPDRSIALGWPVNETISSNTEPTQQGRFRCNSAEVIGRFERARAI
jgi:hypothetical protein